MNTDQQRANALPADSPRSTASERGLDRLFNPGSIALVGATERSIWARSAVENLRRFGYRGKVHMVNPKGGEVFGERAHESCAAIGEPVDLALLMVPQSAVFDALGDLENAQIRTAVLMSSGFAETGAEGTRRQRELSERARQAGVRLLGPNCLGFANFTAATPVWTMPLRRPNDSATVAVVSQSGALAGQLEQFAYQQRVGLTHLISTGNEADIDIAEVVSYLATQDEPRAIALFLETVRNPAELTEAVEKARAAGKSIVVLKVGASEISARAAQAHTGSLVGDDQVFSAWCRRHGIPRVNSLEELITTADLLARIGFLPPAKDIALIAMSGGVCEVAADQAEQLKVRFAELSPSTYEQLHQDLPGIATPNNPLDITGAAMLQPELITSSITSLTRDPAVGLVMLVFDVPPKPGDNRAMVEFLDHISQGFRDSDVPGLVLSHTCAVVGRETRRYTDSLGLTYTGAGLQYCLNAISHIHSASCPPLLHGDHARPTGADQPRPKSERELLEYLRSFNVAVIPGGIATTADEAIEFARQQDGPAVLKVASPDIAHKTEVGGVVIGVQGDAEVGQAFVDIMTRTESQCPDARIDGVIISPLRDKGVELLVGVMRDPQWGPAITVALGGVFVEALQDSSLRLLPVTESDALDMLDELRGRQILEGFRGSPPVDRRALAHSIVAIGEAALALGPDVAAFEVNPILATNNGAEALDAAIIWENSND